MSMNSKRKDDNKQDQDGADKTEKVISNALVTAAAGLMRQCLLDAFHAHKNGRKGLDGYGIDREVLKKFSSIDSIELEELLLNHARIMLARSNTLANVTFDLNALQNAIKNHHNDKSMMDSYLLAGASNSLIKKVFGRRSLESCHRRDALGIENKRGRKIEEPSKQEFHEAYNTYEKYLKQTGCKKVALLKVYDDTKLHIDLIFRIVTSNNDFDL